MRQATVSIAMCAMCLAFSSGCAAWTDKSKNKDSMWSSMQFWKKPYQKPNKLAAIWTHDILTMSGKPPTRGFGGRLYFYNDKSQAIPVEGELIVHGYEETRIGLAVQTEKTKADKTFMFTAEQFTEHFSPSDLGASYSIWIPWDGADGVQKEITLIPTFKGKEGAIVQGEPAKLVLPGRKSDDPFAAAAIQHVSFQQSQTPTNMGPLPVLNGPPASGLRTTTISMPAKTNRSNDNGNTGYNANNSSVVVRDSTNTSSQNGMNSNMTYAGTPQARANAMYAAFANQANARATVQQASMSMPPNGMQPGIQPGMQPGSQQPTGNGPYPSTMPNMLQTQMQQPMQQPMQQSQTQGSAMPQNQYLLQNPGSQNPGMQNSSTPNMRMPNTQMPATQPMVPNQQMPQQNLMNEMNPGFASTYSPLQPGAVEAAFASVPQFQPFGQARLNNQVQPAAYNSMQPTANAGQVQGQFQALPGQPMFQR